MKKDDIIEYFVARGAEIAGTASTGLLSGIVDGAPGIFLGAIHGTLITEVFKKVGKELRSRAVGDREMMRAGAAFTFALEKISSKIEAGEQVRSDDFFEDLEYSRSASTEILEAILQFSQNEYEEMKVRHLGYLLGSIYFDTSIDRGRANFLVRLAERLSFRQLCLIQIFSNTEKYQLFEKYVPPVINDWFQGRYLQTINPHNLIYPSKSYAMYSVLSDRKMLLIHKPDLEIEINELKSLSVIDDEHPHSPVGYSSVKLSSIGSWLNTTMYLDQIEGEELEKISSLLRYKEQPYSSF
ncbi:hypothetical protein GCM10023091_33810 [Ravibacter arvi]|uniref:Uncharacterized protein n=1 Tax=Ravibacter arvi TaxID=2051041 RepID=A0ABP8M403_9BACT